MKNITIVSIGLILALASLSVFSVGKETLNSTPPVNIQKAQNLQQIAQQARERNLPVLLVFAADHCPYCELLEEEILKPMLISGNYNDRVLIYQLNLDDGTQIIDFDGNKVYVSDVTTRYDVFVTPTMLFIDNQGNELDERILGINTIEMFGGLVDDAIDVSLSKLRGNKKVAQSVKPGPAL